MSSKPVRRVARPAVPEPPLPPSPPIAPRARARAPSVTVRSPRGDDGEAPAVLAEARAPAPASRHLLNRLRMRQVALLLAIHQHRTLGAAAAQLGMTQPAATKMLHELEASLGQPLFERAGRGLRLTEAGACAVAHFEGLRGTVEALAREMRELQSGSTGMLRIGSIMAASPDCLTEALVKLKAGSPQLCIDIAIDTSDKLVEQLREGTLDLVIGRLPGMTSPDFLVRRIADEGLVVVAAADHPLVGRRRVSFAALQAWPWVLHIAGSPMHAVIEQEFRSHQAALPSGLIQTSSILTTTNLLMRTRMLSVVPESVARRFAAHGMLGTVDYRFRHRLPSYGSIVRRDRPTSRAATRLLALLHDADAAARHDGDAAP